MRSLTAILCGRRMYETLRYWDDDHAGWHADEPDYAAAWRSRPKWVVSRTLKSVGPNATLIEQDVEAAVHRLKTDLMGDIEAAGPELAGSLTSLA